MAIGSGKSVLASFVITLIQEHGETEPQVLFFFCKDSSDDTSAAASIMTNLIDQLIGQNPLKTLFQILNKARQKHAKSEKCTDFELLWKIFVAMAQEFPIRIVIVIDALDECVTDRSEFLGKILSSNKDTDGKVQFFITSRQERDITDKFAGHCEIFQCGMSVDADIERFVVQRVHELERLRHSESKGRIIDEVPKKSAGMFRYAALLLDELDSPSTSDITDLLNSPPVDLNEMYERILLRLDSADTKPRTRHMRRKIFSWVAVAKLPLTVAEIAYACAIQDDETLFDPTKRILAVERDLLDICGPLLEILDGKVQFTHQSAKEFLLQRRADLYLKEKRDRVDYYLLQEREAHASVGITCSE
jgi:hypothetical protein